MRHPYQVSIVPASGPAIIVAKRSTLDKANAQASSLRAAIGQYNRGGVPAVVVADLRLESQTGPRAYSDEDED